MSFEMDPTPHAPVAAKPARKRKRKPARRVRAVKTVTAPPAEKPKLPNLNPNDAALWQETARNAQEGATKLARAVDVLREGLQTLVTAEMDYSAKPPMPVSAHQLRAIAVETLDAYSRLTGQNWRNPRHQVVQTRAGSADGAHGKNVGNDGADYD